MVGLGVYLYISDVEENQFGLSLYIAMNRRKKLQPPSDQDDQVSIFDSEQQAPTRPSPVTTRTHKKPPPKSNKKANPKNKEKRLTLEEESIIKLMNGEKDKVKEEYTQPAVETMPEVKMQEAESQSYTQHPAAENQAVLNNLDEEALHLKKEQEDLNLSDFDQIGDSSGVQKAPPQKRPYHFKNPLNRHRGRRGNAHNYEYQPQPIYTMPEQSDRAIELKFQDFQIQSSGSGDSNLYQQDPEYCQQVKLHQIQQLQRELNAQGKESHKVNYLQKQPPQQRKITILKQIEQLRQELYMMEMMDNYKPDEQLQFGIINDPIEKELFQQWKYHPIQLKKTVRTKEQEEKCKQNWIVSRSKTEGRINMLREVLGENPFLTQVEMVSVLKKRDPVMNERIERSVVLRLLKMGGFKKKKAILTPRDCNTPINIQMRQKYAHRLRHYQCQGYRICYYDQMLLSEYFDKESGWCAQEKEVQLKPQKYIARSIVVMTLLGDDGICRWSARYGDFPTQHSQVFSNLLKSVNTTYPQPRLLIINPLCYRKPKVMVQIAQRRNWNFLTLPIRPMQLNPLFTYFEAIKDFMRKRRYQSFDELFEVALNNLNDADSRPGMGQEALARAQAHMNKALKGEPLAE